jgi:hypothetical protein
MMTAAMRLRAYRSRQRELGLEDTTRRNAKEFKHEWKRTQSQTTRAFVGCDGEGCGADDIGRQLYMLFSMGKRELFTGCRLTTWEILDFICDEPNGSILVGFAFGYDVTMILRDLPEAQQRKLFRPKSFQPGHSPYVWYKDFDIDYLPKQYFRVKRVKVVRGTDGSERRVPIAGSQRTIYETFGFFQKSFLKCIKDFNVGTADQRSSIEENKARRSSFETIGQEERDYCELECQLLADMMTNLREYCHAAGIIPKTWNGAGKLASALHSLHGTPKSSEANLWVPQEVQTLAGMAYYGGRFEITRTGEIKDKVYEYDIRSAYPDAMRKLPCLNHGVWRLAGANELKHTKELFVASCLFRHGASDTRLGGLPVRSKEGHLYWPRQAGGIYWSPEIRSAERLGAEIRFKSGYVYERHCDCQSFDWVERLYDYRRSIGAQGAGYPIKLGINSLYGKLAQRKGNGVYNNMVWAGLITAFTRAKINDAIALSPDNIVMVATDAVYSLKPLELETGDGLGQWEAAELDGLFIVQPGLYWCPAKRKRKSRGLSGSFFERPGITESFENSFANWRPENENGLSHEFPSQEVPVPGFIGLKLALARNKPDLAGTWVNETRSISFDYRNKRQGHTWHNGHIVTNIKPGSPGLLSLPHRDFLAAGGQEPWENARIVLEEQPDWIDFSPPFED